MDTERRKADSVGATLASRAERKSAQSRARHASPLRNAAVLLAIVGCVSAAHAWSEPQLPLRRQIDLVVDADRIGGEETVVAEFFAPGLAKPDASDLRIAAEDGKVVPMRVIRGGADNRVIVVFNPERGKSRYFAYWGNADAPAKPMDPPVIRSGLLVEAKRPAGGQMDSVRQLQQLWERSGDVIGRGLMPRFFQGFHPAKVEGPSISRITGQLYAPVDGEYQLALSADDRGGLKIDGNDAIFAPGFPEDIRFNITLQLKRGSHAIEYYHFDAGGDWRVSMGWRRPDTPKVEPIAGDAFGRVTGTKVGRLEQFKKDVTADFTASWLGECFVADRSAFRLRFEAQFPDKSTNVRATWSFGDGQTAQGLKADHAFLTPGVYEITLDLKTTQGLDKRTWKIRIERDPSRMIDPAVDEPGMLADLIDDYDFDKLSPTQQSMATRILARGKKVDSLLRALAATCASKKHTEQQWTIDGIEEAIETATNANRIADLAAALAKLSPESNLHPKAADLHAGVLLWRNADFKQAGAMLEAFKDRDSNNLKRLRMEALLLDGKVEEARKVLETLPLEPDVGKRVALSGAMARSIEYFIDNNETDAAEKQWEEWQRKYPESFWEGYSALLKVRMLEPSYPRVAAKVAEAFALAVPGSAYSPQLLDHASRMLAKPDPDKSAALRKLLKEKYPEDPLSQDR